MNFEVKQYLLENGMNKQAVEGKTADKIVELMLRMFANIPVDKAKGMLDDTISEKQSLLAELECKVNLQKDELESNRKLKASIDNMMSPYAKETVSLYKSLVDVGIKAHAEPDVAVSNAGYAIYAYLGGKARTIITDGYEE